MDFEGDIKRHVLSVLPYDRSDLGTVADLSAMPATTLLVYYFNWLGRLVQPKPRAIHQSKELIANPLATSFAAPLSGTISKIETGIDINSHLSKRIDSGYKSTAGKKNLGNRSGGGRGELSFGRGVGSKKIQILLLSRKVFASETRT
jgi:hypothetical protein